MQKSASSLGILFIILVFILFAFWVYLDRLGKRYDQVQAELPEAKNKFAALNHATLSLIPPPDHVSEMEREDWGIDTDYWYGVTTNVTYSIEDSELDVQGYYRSLMERLGWESSVSMSVPQNDDY